MGMNRKALRADLAANVTAHLTVSAVHKCLPSKLAGKSPVITIETGKSLPAETPETPGWPGLIVGIWVRHDVAETAEDELDDLVDAFIDMVNEHYNARWNSPTEPSYEVDDGVLYRVEWHELMIEWW